MKWKPECTIDLEGQNMRTSEGNHIRNLLDEFSIQVLESRITHVMEKSSSIFCDEETKQLASRCSPCAPAPTKRTPMAITWCDPHCMTC